MNKAKYKQDLSGFWIHFFFFSFGGQLKGADGIDPIQLILN